MSASAASLGGEIVADTPKIVSMVDARRSVEQARQMLERARLMWSNAHETLQVANDLRASLRRQIEDLYKDGSFHRRLATRLLSKILDAAIESTGADMGNIQLFDPKAAQLFIHVQRGFEPPFLEFFSSVHVGEAACGTALKTAKRVIVPDVASSPIFSSGKCLETMLDAGARAVQSTPLIGKSGRIWGMLSTHYRTVKQPSKGDLRLIDYFADQAAGILEEEHRFLHHGGGASTPEDADISGGFLL